MKKNRLFKLTIAAVLLATLLTGCHEVGDKPSTSAGTTEMGATAPAKTTIAATTSQSSPIPEGTPTGTTTAVPEVTKGIETEEDHSNKVTGPMVESGAVFYSFDEFCAFYEIFQRQNTAPIVMINWDDAEASCYYCFGGGPVDRSDFLQSEYDYPYPNPRFEFSIYQGFEGQIGLNYSFDIAISGECLIQSDPIENFDHVQIIHQKTFRDTGSDGTVYERRRYEFYQEDVLLITVDISAPTGTDDSVYNEYRDAVRDSLVYLG